VSEGTKYGLAKRRQLALVLSTDLAYLQSSGTVAKALLPFFDAAQLEAAELVLAYEGEAGTPNHRALSVPRRALLDDFIRAGVFMRGELARYVQTKDPDAGSRAITAMGRRSAILEKLGLEHAEREIDLSTYLAQKAAENRAEGANGDDPANVARVNRRRHGTRHDTPRGRRCLTNAGSNSTAASLDSSRWRSPRLQRYLWPQP
jgi:hypothetical protein